MKALTTTVARILFAIPFGIFGLLHFMNASMMKGYVPIPGGVFWVYLTGIALLAACISILTGKMGKLSSLLLAAFLAIVILTIHIPGLMKAADQTAMAMTMTNFLKDIALMGAALTYSGIFAEQESGAKVEEKVSA